MYKSQKLLLLDNSVSQMDLPPNLMAVKQEKDLLHPGVDDWLGDLMGNEAFDDTDQELVSRVAQILQD